MRKRKVTVSISVDPDIWERFKKKVFSHWVENGRVSISSYLETVIKNDLAGVQKKSVMQKVVERTPAHEIKSDEEVLADAQKDLDRIKSEKSSDPANLPSAEEASVMARNIIENHSVRKGKK